MIIIFAVSIIFSVNLATVIIVRIDTPIGISAIILIIITISIIIIIIIGNTV